MNVPIPEGHVVEGVSRVTPSMVDILIAESHYWHPPGTRTIVCCLVTHSGACFVGSASCQPGTPFSVKVGLEEAKKKAYDRLYEASVYFHLNTL